MKLSIIAVAATLMVGAAAATPAGQACAQAEPGNCWESCRFECAILWQGDPQMVQLCTRSCSLERCGGAGPT